LSPWRRQLQRLQNLLAELRPISGRLPRTGKILQPFDPLCLKPAPVLGATSPRKFYELYKQWKRKLSVSMRQSCKAGETTFVDQAGQTVEVGGM
jgi:hypothetical protein